MSTKDRLHGGSDALGEIEFDFSTNANACGPCPITLEAVKRTDPSRYPDPTYTALKQHLAVLHGVEASRIVIATSASEFIFRMTSLMSRHREASVWTPDHAYGDYRAAADAWMLGKAAHIEDATLAWVAEPASPLGVSASVPLEAKARNTVIDCAYEPLRLDRSPQLMRTHADSLWQLWSPNKALGMTGIRGAYAIAPTSSEVMVEAIESLAPSWPIGVSGVAMLTSWSLLSVQTWLVASRVQLSEWKLRMIELMQGIGWTCWPSETNFFCVDPQLSPVNFQTLAIELRSRGIKLRNAASFGLPGMFRVSVQSPRRQDALLAACSVILKGMKNKKA